MQIKRLRLTGFKSFVDPADLRIEPGLTGIVGPNGCGKSNLLEALRWVMGEVSAKSLRGAGMDDVIFAGTGTRPRRDFAEVSVLVDSDTREREIVRRIERGAGSAYRIDGNDVRAKDVALLFADAATGAHSPALVSQGRIGAVIAAKPAERRAMLEEAAGISGLHVRRRDAELKLRATEANLAKLDDIIAAQDASIAALRRQARQAERYRAISEQIRMAEARTIFARWRDADRAADAAIAEADVAERAVAQAVEAQRAAAAHHIAAVARVTSARATALTARDQASEIGHRITALKAEQGAVARRIAELAESRGRMAADREREGALAHDAAAAIADLSAQAKGLEQRIAAAGGRRPHLDAALADAERNAASAEVALAQALAAQAQEAADTRVAQAALAAARVRADRAERDAARLAQEATMLGDPQILTKARDTAAEARRAAAASMEATLGALAAAEGAERVAIDRRDAAQAARAAAYAERAALDAEHTALSRAAGDDGRDRLLDRIIVEPGFERALAAALGDDLHAGLDPAHDRHWAGAQKQPRDPLLPQGSKSLLGHVEAPPVLARRLAQIIVAEADGGQPLAVGQRLVTLDGKLRRWDGYVAASGSEAAAERLKRANRLREIDALMPAAIHAIETADGTLAAVNGDINAARADAAGAREVIARLDGQLREAARDEDRASAAIERLAAQRADLEKRAERLAGERDEAAADLDRIEQQLAGLPDGKATILAVQSLQSSAAACRAAVAQARTDRAALDRDIAADSDRLAAAQSEARNWRKRAGDAARRIADMGARKQTIDVEAAALAGRPAAIATQLVELEESHAAAQNHANGAIAAEAEAEAAQRAAETASRDADEALAQMREHRAGAAARLENQVQRRTDAGRVSGDRFGCPAPVLPERLAFAPADVGLANDEAALHDRLSLERERIGPVNLIAETELAELETARAGNAAESAELAQAVHRLRGSIGHLNREGRQRLLAAFEAVDGHFRRLFTTLFNGGQAHLALVDSDDPLEAGLEIMAQPPGKKLQSLTLLSGGEQALTAVALIFGLFLTNPAPICVLDEVDAPLDDANIERFCDLLDDMARATATRYLIVTHNAFTMSRMHRLFGVTMIEQGVSRLVSVDLGTAETLLAAE